MNQHIQTLKRFNAWRRGDDRDEWKAEADMRTKEIDIWKNECKILRIELRKADGALEENIVTVVEHRAEIESLRSQLGIAKKNWLN